MKKVAAFLCTVLCVSWMICLAVFGAVSSFAANIDPNIMLGRSWTSVGVRISDRYVNGGKAIFVSPEDDAEKFTMQSSFDSVSTVGCNELVISLSLRGELSEYEISVVLGSGDYRTDAFVKSVVCGKPQKLYVPLTSDVSQTLDHIEISVVGTELPLYAIFYGISVDDKYSYATVDSFDSDNVECALGTLSVSSNGLELAPAPSGGAAVAFGFLSDTLDEGTYVVWLDTSGSVGGTLSLKAELDGKEVPAAKEQILAAGDHSNVFLVDGAFSKLSFTFENLSFTGNAESLNLTGAGALYLRKNSADEQVGTVLSCKYENGRVAVKGKLTDEAALKYVNAKLGLYVIPMWKEITSNLFKKAPDVISGFSTLFTVYAEPDENYMNCMYLPVIVAGNDEIIPIGTPKTVYGSSQSSAKNTIASSFASALDKAHPWGAAEAGVGAEIIDIDINRLLEAGDIYSASLYSYRGDVYYFNGEYFDELSRHISFSAELGIKVYARITGSDGALGFDPTDADSLNSLCAACDYIKSNLGDKIRGYIIGNALNTESMSSPKEIDNLAKLTAVFAEALRTVGDSEIYLPFDSGGAVNPFAAYAALRCTVAKYSFAPVSMLYSCTDSPEKAAAAVSRAAGVANSYGYSTDGCAVIWKAPDEQSNDDISSAYAALCKTTAASDLRFAALDADFSKRDSGIYSSVKTALALNKTSFSGTEFYSAALEAEIPVGSYTVKSFERSFDTTGWTAGGVFKGVTIEMSLLKGSRALRTRSQSDGVGMLTYRLENAPDIGKTTAAISLGIVSDSIGYADVTVVFGGKDIRREYSANIEYNNPATLFCNMGDGAAATEHITVTVRGADDSVLELYDVKLQSSTASDEELADRFSEKQNDHADPMLYTVIIAAAALTAAVFFALTKRKGK